MHDPHPAPCLRAVAEHHAHQLHEKQAELALKNAWMQSTAGRIATAGNVLICSYAIWQWAHRSKTSAEWASEAVASVGATFAPLWS